MNIDAFLNQLINRYPQLSTSKNDIDKACGLLINCFTNNGKLFCAGNGGSATDCEHIVGELMKGFILKRPVTNNIRQQITDSTHDEKFADEFQMGLPCIALTSHPALNTAYMNDCNPDMIFAQQLFVLGNSNDVLLGISTSGNSKNVFNAMKIAKAKNMKTILLTGKYSGKCEQYADIVIHTPEIETYKIQELHLPIYHTICMILEDYFFHSI